MTTSSPVSNAGFTCDCIESARSACSGLDFYDEYEGRRYCVLHLPHKRKTEDFRNVLSKKLQNNDFNFRGVWFPVEVSLAEREIHAKADFGSATFTKHADFSGTVFSAGADFGVVTFGGVADFGRATVNGDANFGSAVFAAAANFTGATFVKSGYFVSAKFQAEADFIAATFSNEVDFDWSRFSADANFSGTVFKSKASWDGVVFRKSPDFGGATFDLDDAIPKRILKKEEKKSDDPEPLMQDQRDNSSSDDTKLMLIEAFRRDQRDLEPRQIAEAVANVIASSDLELMREHNRSLELRQTERLAHLAEERISTIELSKVRLRFAGLYMAGVLSMASGAAAVFLVKYGETALSLGFVGIAAACAGAAFAIATGVPVTPRDFARMLFAGRGLTAPKAGGVDRKKR